MDSSSDRSGRSDNQGKPASKIVFNGVEYESVDEMPTYARNLYEQTIKAAGTEMQEGEGHRGRAGMRFKQVDAEPAFSLRSIIAIIAIIALALLGYYLFR